ncbi:winged helix-turn-helix domain-containing protein [Streptomyces lancefieldiae]|uniref:Winged helix-turn-helix domain-containing protein n=1 Tax=Streptomyces lancefieldiae TaxID=3075520 RepID=A0ABU3AP66_9ACTN|nr:winged helix-turn-helix domain-containing protein [Streptomyces sp. DSM 40712]MDT0611981.1 winged helix-turn-helix domain-containing protein [Streptomyces sp. DSM 40712]
MDAALPPWRRVAKALEERIADGTYPKGSQLPGAVPLSVEFDVAPSTVAKAVRDLKNRGLLIASPGWGTFVA